MSDRRSRARRYGTSGAGLLAAAAVAVLPCGPAGAVPFGSWGAGHYPYLDGLICTAQASGGLVSTPLVSWDLGAAGSPAFLTAAVTSTDGIDSAAPPLPSVGAQSVRSVVAGDPGFRSDAEIATYASLISRFGSGGGSEQTAEVANAVLAEGSGRATSCGDTTAEAALVGRAADLSGPYTVRVTSRAPPARPGVPRAVTATVLSATGSPVPDAAVQFSAADGSLSPTAATTDDHGDATVELTAPLGTTRRVIAVHATTALPIGLDEVTAQGVPTTTDPTGAVVPAVRVADPVQVSATARMHIDRSAAPVLQVRAQPTALVVGSSTTPRVHITGMYGHRATVHVDVAGPVRLSDRTLCSGVTAADFAGARTTTYTLATTGDFSAAAGRWVPTEPGCYRVSAGLSTVDAFPAASTRAVASRPVTVLDTTASATARSQLVAAGDPAAGAVHLTDTHGLGGTVHLRLIGPAQPTIGAHACAGADFAQAPTGAAMADRLASDTRPGATLYSVPTSGVGCYRLAGVARLRLSDGSAVRIPIRSAEAGSVLAISPRITYSMSQIWAYRDGTVSARATVIGTYGAPAHVSLRLARVPNGPLGCRSVDGTSSAANGRETAGPPVAVSTDLQTVSISSGRLVSTGCYAPLAVLTMDGDPSIRAVSRSVPAQSVEVGVDPRSLHVEDVIQARTIDSGPSAEWVSGLGYVLLVLCALGFAGAAAWRARREC